MADGSIDVYINFWEEDFASHIGDDPQHWFDQLGAQLAVQRPNQVPVKLNTASQAAMAWDTSKEAFISSARLFVPLIGREYFARWSVTKSELNHFLEDMAAAPVRKAMLPVFFEDGIARKLPREFNGSSFFKNPLVLDNAQQNDGISVLAKQIWETLDTLQQADETVPTKQESLRTKTKPKPANKRRNSEKSKSAQNFMWLCQYNPSEMQTLETRIKEGQEEEWRITNFGPRRLRREMSIGDPVVLWRTNENDDGGLVAWAEISDLSGIQEEDKAKARIKFRITHSLLSEPVPRQKIYGLLGKSNWPNQGALKQLDDKDRAIIEKLKPKEDPQTPSPETAETKFSADRPETMLDRLGRAPLAFALSYLINDIYSEQKKTAQKNYRDAPDAAAFILHIDSPWGGGKTTFANFVSRILNPEQYKIDISKPKNIKGTFFEQLSLDNKKRWPPKFRERKWISVQFNAWQHQHMSPPWWDFYDTIRKQCFATVPFGPRTDKHIAEWLWRIFSPELWRMIATIILFSIFAFLIFKIPGALDWITKANEKSAAPFILATLTGASGLAIIGAVRGGIRKLIDSAGESTDVTNLGTSDPLRRFRDHFGKMIKRLRQPILITVDDLDRCEPAYVVELIRGMLTVFRSPHIVFVLLGDRNWIETAFAEVHNDMASAHRQSEISFGARFVEKAIQMSLLLPKPQKFNQDSYFNHLLLGNTPKQAATGEKEISKTDVENLNDELNSRITNDTSLEEQDDILDELIEKQAETSGETTQMLHGMKAMVSAARSMEKTEDIKHAISPLKDQLPPNPRRIKRIVNMIAVYQSSAHAIFKVTKEDTPDKWYQVILWTILLSEHPRCWRILCEKPRVKGRTAEEKRQLRDPAVSKLLDGSAIKQEDVKIDAKALDWLRQLTPIA